MQFVAFLQNSKIVPLNFWSSVINYRAILTTTNGLHAHLFRCSVGCSHYSFPLSSILQEIEYSKCLEYETRLHVMEADLMQTDREIQRLKLKYEGEHKELQMVKKN